MFNLFRRNNTATGPTVRTWTAPGGEVSNLYYDMLEQPHLLIAGATGSGKSVVINGLLKTLFTCQTPTTAKVILIDPKRVELREWRNYPHVIRRETEPARIVDALRWAVDEMENRFQIMERRDVKRYTGNDIYIFIDEYADLITTSKKDVEPLIIRLAQLGRAAGIHLILATQRPTRDIITGQIKVNIDSRLALRCPTGQDSRNVLDVKGAEDLPRYGRGIYLTPGTMKPTFVDIPAPENCDGLRSWWTRQ